MITISPVLIYEAIPNSNFIIPIYLGKVTYLSTTAIPEPSVTVIASCLAGLACFYRFRSNTSRLTASPLEYQTGTDVI